jgi:hypothetical protein
MCSAGVRKLAFGQTVAHASAGASAEPSSSGPPRRAAQSGPRASRSSMRPIVTDQFARELSAATPPAMRSPKLRSPAIANTRSSSSGRRCSRRRRFAPSARRRRRPGRAVAPSPPFAKGGRRARSRRYPPHSRDSPAPGRFGERRTATRLPTPTQMPAADKHDAIGVGGPQRSRPGPHRPEHRRWSRTTAAQLVDSRRTASARSVC